MLLRGALTGLIAAVLLPAGGLEAVKQVAVIAAFPFPFVVIGLCVSLVETLRAEPAPAPSAKREGAAGESGPDDEVRPAEVMPDSQPAG